jgi:hypothetical protein
VGARDKEIFLLVAFSLKFNSASKTLGKAGTEAKAAFHHKPSPTFSASGDSLAGAFFELSIHFNWFCSSRTFLASSLFELFSYSCFGKVSNGDEHSTVSGAHFNWIRFLSFPFDPFLIFSLSDALGTNANDDERESLNFFFRPRLACFYAPTLGKKLA